MNNKTMNLDLNKEKELFDKVKSDKKNFDLIYKYFLNDVYRFAYSILGNQHDAEDIASQTFIEFYKKFDSFEWQGISMKNWLFRVARNLSYSKFRILESPTIENENELVDETEISFVDEIMQKDLLQEIKTEVDKLTPSEKNIVNLRIWEGMNYAEIGEINDLSEDAARMKFNRAIKKIRESLNKRNITRLLALPILFTGIAQLGATPAYAAPAALGMATFGSVLLSQTTTMTTLGSVKAFLATKAGIAILSTAGIATVVGGGYLGYRAYTAPKDSKQTEVSPTPTIETSPSISLTSAPIENPRETIYSEKFYFTTSGSQPRGNYNIQYYFAEYDSITGKKTDLYTHTILSEYTPQAYEMAANRSGDIIFGHRYFTPSGPAGTEIFRLKNGAITSLYKYSGDLKDSSIVQITFSEVDDNIVYISSNRHDNDVTLPNDPMSKTDLIQLNINTKATKTLISGVQRSYKIIANNAEELLLTSYPTENFDMPGDNDNRVNVDYAKYNLGTSKLEQIKTYRKGELSHYNPSNGMLINSYRRDFTLGDEVGDGNPSIIEVINSKDGSATQIYSDDKQIDFRIIGWISDKEIAFHESDDPYKRPNAEFTKYIKAINIETKQVRTIYSERNAKKFYDFQLSADQKTIYILRSTTGDGSELIVLSVATAQTVKKIDLFNRLLASTIVTLREETSN
jgi:RNA polymerase sigma-70 factor (ECF subfamily)